MALRNFHYPPETESRNAFCTLQEAELAALYHPALP
jgi:hypothetical protein